MRILATQIALLCLLNVLGVEAKSLGELLAETEEAPTPNGGDQQPQEQEQEQIIASVRAEAEEEAFEDQLAQRLKCKVGGQLDFIRDEQDLQDPKKLAQVVRTFSAKMDCNDEEHTDPEHCAKKRSMLERLADDIGAKKSLKQFTPSQLKVHQEQYRKIMASDSCSCKLPKVPNGSATNTLLRRIKRDSSEERYAQSLKKRNKGYWSWWWGRFVKWSLWDTWSKDLAQCRPFKFLGKLTLGLFGFLPVFVVEVSLKIVTLFLMVVGACLGECCKGGGGGHGTGGSGCACEAMACAGAF